MFLAAVCLTACGDAVEMPRDGSMEGGNFVCDTEEDVASFVFAPTCATSRCHDADVPSGRLDLETPGITERITGRMSIHRRCSDQALLVPGDPAASFMMRKVLGTHDDCGDPMPNRGEISPAQRRCIAAWIANVE
ncbi:MAG: hypothetical protein ACI9KE_004366 [Polyangiales bacterium]